jgi:hypothetical protein
MDVMRSPVRPSAKPGRSFLAFLAVLACFVVWLGACGDNLKPPGGTVDAAATDARAIDAPTDGPELDAPPIDAHVDAMIDAMTDASIDGSTVDQIQAARDAADVGGLTLPIEGVYVTYLKPAVGNDPAGFTIQASMDGPALFIAVDPASLNPAPVVGDEVSFTITAMASSGGLRQATSITDFTRLAQGFNVNALVQNISAAADVVTMINSYESELIDVTGTLTGAFVSAGSMFEEIQLQTAGVPNDPNLKVRLPSALRDALDVAPGCTLTLDNTPVGRFTTRVQLTAFRASELMLSNCPAPTVTGAIATSPTTVVVTFSRRIDPASVHVNGDQFTFDSGLTATAAVVSGRTVTVTTTAQSIVATYTVTVANTVTDLMGTGVGLPNSAMFPGFVMPAVVRINEFNAHVSSPAVCDLIELRVVQGGTLLNVKLNERLANLITFPAFVAPTNAIIVVHLNSANAMCNPGGATMELLTPLDQPRLTFGANFDTAYDFYSADTGLTDTDNVWTLLGPTGLIMDAVLTANAPTGTAAADSETAAASAAAANEWQNVGGGQPAGGYVDDVFRANAVLDLDGTSTTGQLVTSTSIQRLDNTDDNDKADWNAEGPPAVTVQVQTFGLLNVGQTLF